LRKEIVILLDDNPNKFLYYLSWGEYYYHKVAASDQILISCALGSPRKGSRPFLVRRQEQLFEWNPPKELYSTRKAQLALP
jgi:hypothetical protein